MTTEDRRYGRYLKDDRCKRAMLVKLRDKFLRENHPPARLNIDYEIEHLDAKIEELETILPPEPEEKKKILKAIEEIKADGKTEVSVIDIVLKTGIDGERVEVILDTLSPEAEDLKNGV